MPTLINTKTFEQSQFVFTQNLQKTDFASASGETTLHFTLYTLQFKTILHFTLYTQKRVYYENERI